MEGTFVDENYTDAMYDSAEVGAKGSQVPDTMFTTMGLISSDPRKHVRRLKAMKQLGPTAIVIIRGPTRSGCSGSRASTCSPSFATPEPVSPLRFDDHSGAAAIAP